MIQVSTHDFLNRVVTSNEQVTFSFVDPYSHLSTSRYLEIFVNHRIAAPEEHAGLATMTLAQEMKIGIVFHAVNLKFLFPSFLGEKLQVASWVSSIHETGFSVQGFISGTKDARAKAVMQADLRSVDIQTGRPVKLPHHLPCREAGLLDRLPKSVEFLKTIKGIPNDFYQQT